MIVLLLIPLLGGNVLLAMVALHPSGAVMDGCVVHSLTQPQTGGA